MRRLAWVAAALAAACGETFEPPPGELDRVYLPTGLAVHAGRLVVASSNGDLRFDVETGGTLLALDPTTDPAAVDGAIRIRSFAGDLAIADPAQCPQMIGGALGSDAVAILATRGSNVIYAATLDATGALSCDGCEIPLSGTFGEPYAVAIACGGGRARAFVGHLAAPQDEAWISELDLATGELRNMSVGPGRVRGFAYDAARDRLYLVGLATSSPTPLRWIDLGGCTVGAAPSEGGCVVGQVSAPFLTGLELRSIALGAERAGLPRRAYLTGRYYDLATSATQGGRIGDFGGALLAVDLVDDARGGVELGWVDARDIGRGAQDVRVLPRGPTRGDLVAALTVDDGALWIYDDETSSLTLFALDPETGSPMSGARDPRTGAPVLGHEPVGLAVDPVPIGSTARLYVGSYRDSFVTPIDVPLDAPAAATYAGGGPARRITGGTP